MDDKRKGDFLQKDLLLPIIGMVAAAIVFAITVVLFVAGALATGLRLFENVVASVVVAASATAWIAAFGTYRRRKAYGAANPALAGLHRDPEEAAKVLETLNQSQQAHAKEASSEACRACVEILDAAVEHRDPPGTADFLELLEAVHQERMSGADPAFHPHYKEIHAAIQEARKGRREAFPPWYRIW